MGKEGGECQLKGQRRKGVSEENGVNVRNWTEWDTAGEGGACGGED